MSDSKLAQKDAWMLDTLGVVISRAAQPKGSFVALQKARLTWDSARKQARTEVRRLESAILTRFANEPYFAEVSASTHRLYEMFEVLDDQLLDVLDDALNADEEARRKLHGKAAAIVGEYIAFVKGDENMRLIDDNPIAPIKARKIFVDALTSLHKELRQ